MKKFVLFIFALILNILNITFASAQVGYYIYDYNITEGQNVLCPSNPDITYGSKLSFDLGTNIFDSEIVCADNGGINPNNGKYDCSGFADINNNGIINDTDYTSTSTTQNIGSTLAGPKMKCAIKDDYEPTGTITYAGGNVTTTQSISISGSDIGGSKLDNIELRLNHNDSGFNSKLDLNTIWTSIKGTGSIGPLILNVPVTGYEDGDSLQYRIVLHDRAGNITTVTSQNIIYIDLTPTSGSGWYNIHTRNISDGCDQDGDTIGGEFEFNVGADQNGKTVCGKIVASGKYTCDYATDIDNDGFVNTNDYTSTTSTQKIGSVLAGDTMKCAWYDFQKPEELTLDYLLYSSGTTVQINVSSKDRGGSTLDRIILYRRVVGSTNWVTVKSWTNISDVTNQTISYSYTDSGLGPDEKYIYYLRAWDVAKNYTDLPGHEIIIDNTAPVAGDIASPVPNDYTNLLATGSQNFSFNVSDAGGSPINYIGVFFEDYNSATDSFNSEKISTSTGIRSFNENIQNVDLDRDANGSREYMLRVSKICDAAGNCLGTDFSTSNIDTFKYYVYPNSLNIGTKSVTTNELASNSNIADGSIKNLIITLKDAYGNAIVPATGISRTIDFTWNVKNTMYLNQYIRSGDSSVFTSSGNLSTYTNKFSIGRHNKEFVGENSSSGTYTYGFKFYTPTNNYDTITNGPISDNGAEFNIYSITFDVNGTLGSIYGTAILNNYTESKFSPIYYTQILGDLMNNGFSEGSVQSGSIKIIQSGGVTPTNQDLHIEFGSGSNNSLHNKLDLKYGETTGIANDSVGEGNGHYTKLEDNFGPGTYNIWTKLLLNTGSKLDDIQNSYFSTHISYELDGKTVVYNSDVYGKDSYWGTISSTGNTYESAVKIIGKTYSEKYNEIITGQDGNGVILLNGNITKSSLKGEIKKNVYDLIRSVTPSNGSRTITDLADFSNTSNDGRKLMQDSILYFGNLTGATVTISAGTISGNKTIIVEGGNVYINGNINTSGSNSILGIAAIQDINGNGGNIYINPSVRYIKAILYADKSLISYNGTELDGNTSFDILKNQLYIYGSVFSENTIGGSRASPNIKCPFYVKTTDCDSIEEAQKYDLNYLRRYYLKDSNSDGIIDNSDTPAGGGSSSPQITSSSPNYKYPLVIEYNPLIQTNPPVIFKKK